jgi:hypothetical protein
MEAIKKETLDKARELFTPIEGSRLDKRLSKALESADKLDRLEARHREFVRATGAADSFMRQLANYQIDPHRDGLLEEVKSAQRTQEATSAILAPMRTMITQAENKYKTDALAAHNIAKLIGEALYDAKVTGNTMRLEQRLTKYCGHDAPSSLDIVKRAKATAEAPPAKRKQRAAV